MIPFQSTKHHRTETVFAVAGPHPALFLLGTGYRMYKIDLLSGFDMTGPEAIPFTDGFFRGQNKT
jgi:hypothetical protein